MITKTFDAGTDVAAIGIWDSKYCNDEFMETKFRDYLKNLAVHAKDRWVFYINTGSDGGYPTKVVVDGEVNVDSSEYKKWAGKWGLQVKSGKITVGGLEDFLSTKRQITSESDDLSISNGEYSVEFYEKIEKDDDDGYNYASLSERDKKILRWQGCFVPIGCVWMIASILLIFISWKLGIGLLVSSWLYFFALDKIFKKLGIDEITKKRKTDEINKPVFIFELKKVDTSISGGYVDLH